MSYPDPLRAREPFAPIRLPGRSFLIHPRRHDWLSREKDKCPLRIGRRPARRLKRESAGRARKATIAPFDQIRPTSHGPAAVPTDQTKQHYFALKKLIRDFSSSRISTSENATRRIEGTR